jgi:site-specific DNA recombinase
MSEKAIRCAIYTRKSHTEGLEQAFNSLDAQREAALDYIKSQKHEGWTVNRARYDDGGFSGGNLQRPALQRLLDDIESGGIDVVVVYKVDRLSRSLGDFAQMMERFERNGVSFVSVTQQFNTTNSMGRLTLNMLLSFAQFERDIAGERIRDKLAATRKKGMWVSGQPPLGYRLPIEGEERKLYVVPEEAELVRKIFTGYLEAPSLIGLADRLHAAGHSTKGYRSKTGRDHGARRLTNKYLHRVLTCPLYLGRIPHTEAGERKSCPGLHEAIIDEEVWNRVQELMKKQGRQTRHRWTRTYLLKGKLRTGDNFAMSPGSVHRPGKSKGQKHLVCYYVSQKAIKHGYRDCAIKAINTSHLDELVRAVVLGYLTSISFDRLACQPADVRDHWIREILEAVDLTPEKLVVRLQTEKIEACREAEWDNPPAWESIQVPTCPYAPVVEERGRHIVLSLAIQIKRLDGRRLILSHDGRDLVLPTQPEPRPHLVNAIGLAYRWHGELLHSGISIAKLARSQGMSECWVRRILLLTQLGPEPLKRALNGTLLLSITLEDLLAAASDLDWSRQSRALGLAETR